MVIIIGFNAFCNTDLGKTVGRLAYDQSEYKPAKLGTRAASRFMLASTKGKNVGMGLGQVSFKRRSACRGYCWARRRLFAGMVP